MEHVTRKENTNKKIKLIRPIPAVKLSGYPENEVPIY